jgi:hypothetical protein
MTMRKALVAAVLMPLLAHAGSISIGISFAGLNVGQGAGWVPPDMGFAVGQNQIVQVVNGGYEVFQKTGASLTGPQSDVSLWTNAGIPLAQVTGINNLADPRVLYDPASGRFILSEINATSVNGAGNSNMAFIAASKTSDPASGGWNAFGFVATTGFSNGFADFDTLGIDQNGVYLGTDNFNMGGFGHSISVFSMPKSDLLLGSGANMTELTGITGAAVPHPAYDPNGSHGELIAQTAIGSYELLQLSNTANHPAVLTSVGNLTGVTDNLAVPPLQSDGSQITTNIDDRVSSTPFTVGNLMYVVNSFADPTGSFDVLHWMIINLTTSTLLQQGTISDPGFDYTYPSVAANANGDFVIGFDRSGGTQQGNIESWAVACRYNGASVSCNTPLELSAGDNTVNTDGRMGDYTSTVIDPTNSNIFWTSSEVPLQGSWGTRITELVLTPDSVPEPGMFVLTGALIAGLLWRRRLHINL